MRSSLVIGLILLALVIGGGVWMMGETDAISQRYVSASRELLVLTEDAQWPRAAEVLGAYQETWEDTLSWLQMLVNHDDTDDVTLAMTKIEAGIRGKDASLCLLGCNELQEAAKHIYHRDELTLGNVL